MKEETKIFCLKNFTTYSRRKRDYECKIYLCIVNEKIQIIRCVLLRKTLIVLLSKNDFVSYWTAEINKKKVSFNHTWIKRHLESLSCCYIIKILLKK